MFDSHAHYDDEKFDNDRDEILSNIQKDNVFGIINPGCNIKSSYASIELAKKYDFIHAACGIHPHDASEYNSNAHAIILKMLENDKVVAVGETGLDYHYDFSPRDKQKENFVAHIEMAKKMKMPIIIHDRESHKDVLDIVKAEKAYEVGGVFHCFTGSVEMAKTVLNMGFYIALGGAVTFKNAKKPVEVAKYVPLDRLLVETDAPYMTPVPYRGKKNNSSYIKYIIEKISVEKDISYDVIEKQTTQNVYKLFKINKAI